jgi:hypothetical protein
MMRHGLGRRKSDDGEDQRKTLEDSLKTYKDHVKLQYTR